MVVRMETHAEKFAKQFAEEVRVEMTRQRRTARELAEVINGTPATAGTRLNGEGPFAAPEMARAAFWLGKSVSEITRRAEAAIEADRHVEAVAA